jgi:hypothetical protein
MPPKTIHKMLSSRERGDMTAFPTGEGPGDDAPFCPFTARDAR